MDALVRLIVGNTVKVACTRRGWYTGIVDFYPLGHGQAISTLTDFPVGAWATVLLLHGQRVDTARDAAEDALVGQTASVHHLADLRTDYIGSTSALTSALTS